MTTLRLLLKVLLLVSSCQSRTNNEIETDKVCNYIGRTRNHHEFKRVDMTFEVNKADGSGVEMKPVKFCVIKHGYRCFPDGTEAFTFETHLDKELGVTDKPPGSPAGAIVSIDTFRAFEEELKGFSCASGFCTKKVNGICNGTDNFNSRVIKWADFETRLRGSPDNIMAESVFQMLRDVCFYVRKTRFAVPGDKHFHPDIGEVQWTKVW